MIDANGKVALPAAVPRDLGGAPRPTDRTNEVMQLQENKAYPGNPPAPQPHVSRQATERGESIAQGALDFIGLLSHGFFTPYEYGGGTKVEF